MLPYLKLYPDKQTAEVIEFGFSFGFQIPADDCKWFPVLVNNLKSAALHPEIVANKLWKELSNNRIAGPFSDIPLRNMRISPLGVVPKRELGAYRLIHHLSYPKGLSVNDGISPDLCSVEYSSFDKAINLVQLCGQGTLLAKTDVESAFRLLPIHPDSYYLLGFHFQGAYFYDKCLPMGCSISCRYFEMFANFIEWVIKFESGSNFVIHYLDDFLFLGPRDSNTCSILLNTFLHFSRKFGIPIAREKTVAPTTSLQFLGIEIDTILMEFRLPETKVSKLKSLIASALVAKKLKLKHIQSLIGHLNFATRIIPMGRVFNRRLIYLTMGVSNPNWHIRIPVSVKEDLLVWQQFLSIYNGRTCWQEEFIENSAIQLFTDAAGSTGFGAYLSGRWCCAAWPAEWREQNLTGNLVLLEIFPVLVALDIWGPLLVNKRILLFCDNMGVVQVINNLSAKSPPVVKVMRHLVFLALKYNIWLRARHIPGCQNNLADALSRFQLDQFRWLARGAEQEGEVCPCYLWSIPL